MTSLGGPSTSTYFKEDTLIVEIADRSNREVVWRSVVLLNPEQKVKYLLDQLIKWHQEQPKGDEWCSR
jgi:hypothetical protein